MATTTNYGWTTPDDTALVKDGASAIRTLGTSVDTTTKNLNPETTLGDISFRSSTSNVNTRLGIGGTGTVLTVAAGVPSWATPASGGMTLISTTTLSGASTTISSIPQTYNSLYLVITGLTCNSGDGILRCAPNGVSNLSNYSVLENTTVTSKTDGLIRITETQYLRTDANNAWAFSFDNYTSSARFKPFNFYGFFVATSSVNTSITASGAFRSNTAITSLEFDNFGFGTFASGTILLYGVK
jgi:hypothetical protein